ncbi:hypothetical protein F5Y09DRAFT_326182 [Xylaria sp. FL1042]|nr:hypothetical protein F5Y09DRAFT_326182 [Xylaria sp. FL1042]
MAEVIYSNGEEFSINPWRNGEDNENLRPSFLQSYQNAIGRMARDYNSARGSPAKGYIDRECPMPSSFINGLRLLI